MSLFCYIAKFRRLLMENTNNNSNEVKNTETQSNSNENASSETATSKKTNFFEELCDMVESVLFSIFAVILIFTFLFKVASVVGTSMVPTLEQDDKLIVASAFYNNPKYGDIVIINAQDAHLLPDTNGDGVRNNDDTVQLGDGLHKPIVKRVIATAGQTLDIDFDTGNVYIDGEVINESYINDLTDRDEGGFEYPITIPDGYVFVLGDNRGVSKDSRSYQVGLIPVEDIIGKVVFRISPIEKFGFVD